jgi:hypothetical protein
VTIIGTNVSSASTFEKSRVRQCSQNVPSNRPTSVTKPASTKLDANTPTSEPRTNTPTWRELSNRNGPPVSRRMTKAPINASEQLLMNHRRIIVTGRSFASWIARWAGNADSKSQPQERVGASSSTASRIALGGQRVEIGEGWIVSAKPILDPRK